MTDYAPPGWTKAQLNAAIVRGRPVNVLATGNAKADAFGDSGSHPLSSRFTSLTDAQAVFPRATALSEEIDRHALQLALDNHDHVIAPAFAGNYMIDDTLYTSGADTTRGLGNQTFEMQGTGELFLSSGAFPGGKMFVLASGNTRTTTAYSSSTSADSPPCDGLTLRVRINGNRANLGAAGVVGLYTVNCSDLDLDAIVHDVGGPGIRLYGVTDAYTRNVLLRRVWAYSNGKNGSMGERGLAVSLRHRDVTYLDIKAWDNMADGVFLDHSEATVASIMAWENDGCGIFVHNVTRNRMTGLWAQGNGEHGILVSGSWDSVGSDWVSTGNGQAAGGVAGAGWADVKFDDALGSYGVSKHSRYTNIVCGYYEGGTGDETLTNSVDYALSVDAGVTTDVGISGVKIAGPGLVGSVDVPADYGELSVTGSEKGASVPVTWCGPERTVIKPADQTVNNSTTLVSDTDLSLPVSAGQTWLLDFTLQVRGSDAIADIVVGLDSPAGSAGEIMVLQGTPPGSAGGAGPTSLGWIGVNGTLALAAFASTNIIALRCRVTAGAAGRIGLRWAQNTATASDLTIAANSILTARRIA